MHKYDNNNVFAKILRGDLPSKKVYEDDKILAFYTIQPTAKTHVLIIPKDPFVSYQDFVQNANNDTILHMFKMVDNIAALLNISNSYKVYTNHGLNAGQEVFHFHLHLTSN